MKLHSKIHANGPELVFSDPGGYGATQQVLVGHAACEYWEAKEDANTIVAVLAIHSELVTALRHAQTLVGSDPTIDRTLKAVDTLFP